ncbi:MAG: hypothetical protein OXJ52_06245 [Oligoflexia bacterium]|nr:hypothetical protein [Oligoflexia bacterium]
MKRELKIINKIICFVFIISAVHCERLKEALDDDRAPNETRAPDNAQEANEPQTSDDIQAVAPDNPSNAGLTNGNTNTNTNAETNTDTNANTETNTNAETNTNTEPNTNANPASNTNPGISGHFEDTECNRHYWTFKCALEYKSSQKHSEECIKNITASYPNDENRMKRITAQSKNTESIIKATWTNYFNQHCKDDLSVKEHLKNLN